MMTIYKDYPWGKFYVFALDQNIPLLWDLISIRFDHESDWPKASTCALQLTLPCKHHHNSSSFQENFIFAMLNEDLDYFNM